MKFSVKLIAAALCAAMLCVPALAAASATDAGAYVPNPQYTVISGTVAHQKDGGLMMSTSTGEPTEDYILWTEGVMIQDAVSGEPVDAKSIKDGSTVVGNRTRVKVIKNKVAPPFREAVFDIMYGEGISKYGELLDIAVDMELVNKSGSWFSIGDERIGQGRDSAKQYLIDHPDVADRIEQSIRDTMWKLQGKNAKPPASVAAKPVSVSADDFNDD